MLFAPLYLSNYCVNGCLYCPYHAKNRDIPRRKLTQEEIRAEVVALQDMGHKRLAIEAGKIRSITPELHFWRALRPSTAPSTQNGAIRRVNANIAATTRKTPTAKLKAAEMAPSCSRGLPPRPLRGAAPSGPQGRLRLAHRAHDRAMAAGIDERGGSGVLFGGGLRLRVRRPAMHAEHLEAVFGVGPHTISVPRVKPASDIDPDAFDNGIPDEMFEKIIALIHRRALYGAISTRESRRCARRLQLGVSQISGGSRTSVGGFTGKTRPRHRAVRTCRYAHPGRGHRLAHGRGPPPSFCTACYRAGRTGDRFMEFCKSGQIQDFASRTPCSRWESTCATTPAPRWRRRVEDDRHRARPRSRRPPPRPAADYLARVRTGARLPVLGGVRMSLNDTPFRRARPHRLFRRAQRRQVHLVNALTKQTVSVVSDVAGTTTDPVRKAMELAPAGPGAHC